MSETRVAPLSDEEIPDDATCFCCGLGKGALDPPLGCGHFVCYVCSGRGHTDDHLVECYAELKATLAAANADRARLQARVEELEFLADEVLKARRAHYGAFVLNRKLDALQNGLATTVQAAAAQAEPS